VQTFWLPGNWQVGVLGTALMGSCRTLVLLMVWLWAFRRQTVAVATVVVVADGTMGSRFHGGMPLDGWNDGLSGPGGLDNLDGLGGLEGMDGLRDQDGLEDLDGLGGPDGLDIQAGQDDLNGLEDNHPRLAPDFWVQNPGNCRGGCLPPLDEVPAFGVPAVLRAYSPGRAYRGSRCTRVSNSSVG
jgi:hypothetical protein